MTRRFGALASGAAVIALTGGLLVSSAAIASATTYTFEPDPNSLGTLTFYDANGHVLTGGPLATGNSDTTTSHSLAAYVVGSAPLRTTDTKATLYFATPAAGDPSTWSSQAVNASTTFNPQPAGVVAPVSATSLPVVVGKSTDETLADYSTNVAANALTGANANIYQVRIYTSGKGAAVGSTYDSADVLVDNTAHTWKLMYPTVTTTATSLTSSPAQQTTTAPATLNATVSPASVPGTVTFFDGATQIGSPVAVTGGKASSSPFTPTAGGHSYTARFDPTPGYFDGSAGTAGTPSSATENEYQDSTSTALPQTVSGATTTPPASLAEAPYAVLLLLVGTGVGGIFLARRTRRTNV